MLYFAVFNLLSEIQLKFYFGFYLDDFAVDIEVIGLKLRPVKKSKKKTGIQSSNVYQQTLLGLLDRTPGLPKNN